MEDIRKYFPQLKQTVYGKPLVYLDNAATSLRPESVVEKWTELSTKYNSNLHRAVHYTAAVATEEYESTRDYVAAYLNADRSEIVFTSGCTASINLVAYSFGEKFISEGDEIIVTQVEHHSDIVPWKLLCERKGAVLKVIPVDDEGHLDIQALKSILSDKSKICCVSHISNVLGIVNPVKEIVTLCHSVGCVVLVDGAQGIVHTRPDMKDMDCDFYAFSGHKIYAAPSTGVLYGKKELLERMPPFMGGGEMIESVSFDKITYAPVPGRFEAGTQNMAGTPTLKPALDILDRMQKAENEDFCQQVLVMLNEIPGIRIYGVPRGTERKVPIFSFTIEGVHHEDLALILDKMGIAVRSGQMCAEPLMDRFGVSGMLRASFAPYNTLQEAEYLVQGIKKAISMLI